MCVEREEEEGRIAAKEGEKGRGKSIFAGVERKQGRGHSVHHGGGGFSKAVNKNCIVKKEIYIFSDLLFSSETEFDTG